MLQADRIDTTRRTWSAPGARSRCLRLYHAAPREAVPGILRAGLAPGEVALTPTLRLAAVWLTSDAHACATLGGLDFGPAERALLGFDPAAGLRATTAAPACLTVRVPAGDRRLVRWAEFAPRHLPPFWCAAFARFGAVRTRTWFLFRGPVPAAWIAPLPPAHDEAVAFFAARAAAVAPIAAPAA